MKNCKITESIITNNTVVEDFDFDYDLYQAVKQHGYTKMYKTWEAVKKFHFDNL